MKNQVNVSKFARLIVLKKGKACFTLTQIFVLIVVHVKRYVRLKRFLSKMKFLKMKPNTSPLTETFLKTSNKSNGLLIDELYIFKLKSMILICIGSWIFYFNYASLSSQITDPCKHCILIFQWSIKRMSPEHI